MFEFRKSSDWLGWGAGNDGTIWKWNEKMGWVRYKGYTDAKGYVSISRRPNGIKGKKETVYAHRMVVNCFLGAPLSGRSIVVDHLDNNPSNNALNNLHITNQSDNLRRASELGRIPGNKKGYQREVLTLADYLKGGTIP